MRTFQKNEITLNLKEISDICTSLWLHGWAEASAGNFSVLPDELNVSELGLFKTKNELKLDYIYPELSGKQILVSASGSRMREIMNNPAKYLGILKINETGSACEIFSIAGSGSENFAPTSELATHLAIFNEIVQKGMPEKCVLHCHATELIALSHHPDYRDSNKMSDLLYKIHPEMGMFLKKGITVIPFREPGSAALADDTAAKISCSDIVIWEKHGVTAIGGTLNEALDKIEIANKAAAIYFLCKNAGFEPL